MGGCLCARMCRRNWLHGRAVREHGSVRTRRAPWCGEDGLASEPKRLVGDDSRCESFEGQPPPCSTVMRLWFKAHFDAPMILQGLARGMYIAFLATPSLLAP